MSLKNTFLTIAGPESGVYLVTYDYQGTPVPTVASIDSVPRDNRAESIGGRTVRIPVSTTGAILTLMREDVPEPAKGKQILVTGAGPENGAVYTIDKVDDYRDPESVNVTCYKERTP